MWTGRFWSTETLVSMLTHSKDEMRAYEEASTRVRGWVKACVCVWCLCSFVLCRSRALLYKVHTSTKERSPTELARTTSVVHAPKKTDGTACHSHRDSLTRSSC